MSDSRRRGVRLASGRATQPENGHARLLRGSLVVNVVRLAWPTVVGLLGIFLFNLADVFFLGMLGTAPLAAISFVFPLIFGFITLSIALGIATTALVAQTLGAGKTQEAYKLGSSAILLAFLYGMTLASLGFLTIEPVFKAMGANSETLLLIKIYMRIWYVSSPMLTLLIVTNHLLRAHGIAVFPGLVMLFASVLNILLDPLLIFGLWGLPRLEIAGAAWATLIARALGCLLLLWGLVHYDILGRVRGSLRELFADFVRLIRFAIPASGQNIVQPATEVYMVTLLAGFGSQAVATYGVVTRLYAIIFLPYYAMAAALIPIIAQNWGGTYRARVEEAGRLAVRVALLWGVLCTAPLFVFARPIAELFGSSEDLVAWTTFYFRYIPCSFAFAGLVMLLGSFFYGIAKPFYAFATEAVHWFVLYVPIAYLASLWLGVEGILLSEIAANLLSALLAFAVYRWVCDKGF